MNAKVPSLLNWHFTDRYYHTNLDTVDKVSAVEMQHVAIVVGTTALFIASARNADLPPMLDLIKAARDARIETEKQNGAATEILEAWRRWYDEAFDSVSRLQS
jgi:Zn-dependent M28 family amino/carboxypeptidase